MKWRKGANEIFSKGSFVLYKVLDRHNTGLWVLGGYGVHYEFCADSERVAKCTATKALYDLIDECAIALSIQKASW